jgi:branched-subunit amino acid aminotransferase/4-amino-4-deoxychorismate lyase
MAPSRQTDLAYLNGSLVPYSQAALPLHDAGFVFGATIVDNCRTFRHRLFRLNDHLARFRRSCDAARVPLRRPDAELTEIALELTAVNGRSIAADLDLMLVMFATPGPVAHYAGSEASVMAGPTFGMHTFPLPFGRYAKIYREGARLIVPRVRQLPADCIDPRIKYRSRLHWWLAEQEVHAVDTTASALLLDSENHITETAAANFLLVKGGRVLTPPRDSVLDGISLRVTEELCRELGIPFEERVLGLEDLQTANEAMLSNTSYCLAGVSRINDTRLSWPGPVHKKLLAAWNMRVGLDIREQICATR